MTRGVVGAVLASGLMALATVAVVIVHAIMFGVTRASVGADAASAGMYLWAGTAEAGSTAWAAVVLYRLPWRRLTPGRWLVVALGAASAVLALGLWVTFWSTR